MNRLCQCWKEFGLNFNINFRNNLFFLIPYNDQLGYVPFLSGVRGYIITYIIMYISRYLMTLVWFLHVLLIYNFWKIIWSELIARDTCFQKHQEVVDSIRNWIKYVQRMKNRIDLKTLALVLHFIPFSR